MSCCSAALWHLLFQFPLQSPLLSDFTAGRSKMRGELGRKEGKGLGRNTLCAWLQKYCLISLKMSYPLLNSNCVPNGGGTIKGLSHNVARLQKGSTECVCPWCNPRRSVEQGWPLFSDGYAVHSSSPSGSWQQAEYLALKSAPKTVKRSKVSIGWRAFDLHSLQLEI